MAECKQPGPRLMPFAWSVASTPAGAATYEELFRRPSSAWETLFFAAMLGALLVGIAYVPRRLMRLGQWSRRWRIAGLAPLAPLAVAMTRLIVASAATSAGAPNQPRAPKRANVLARIRSASTSR